MTTPPLPPKAGGNGKWGTPIASNREQSILGISIGSPLTLQFIVLMLEEDDRLRQLVYVVRLCDAGWDRLRLLVGPMRRSGVLGANDTVGQGAAANVVA